MLKKIFDKLNLVFAIIIVILYLVIMPIMLYNEYKTNENFKNLIVCEDKGIDLQNLDLEIELFGKTKCPLNNIKNKLLSKSDFLINITIIFWALIIFENDIYPNRKKILKFFNNIENK